VRPPARAVGRFLHGRLHGAEHTLADAARFNVCTTRSTATRSAATLASAASAASATLAAAAYAAAALAAAATLTATAVA
jgi:hypothetical protein